MSNYVRGLKRQQIINRWLQGHDDPDFEVFPTKKEGKFIVKKRVEPLEQKNDEVVEEEHEEEQNEEVGDEEHEEEVKPKSKPKSTLKPTPKPKPVPKHKRMTSTTNNNDLTVGIEILEQIKLLGEEMKHQRKKKEQKEFVKQVVQKQLTKNPRSRKAIQEEYSSDEGSSSRGQSPYEYEEESQPEPEPEPEPKPVFRSRIRNPKQ